MNKYSTVPSFQWPIWRIIVTGLISLALLLSIMLSWHYLRGGSMIGCDGGSPCEQVLNSKWSSLGGVIPISGLAAGIYLALFVALMFSGPSEESSTRRYAWKAMLVIAGAITGSAIWFTILQKWLIGDFCPYCMSAHITGVLLSILIIRQSLRETNSDHPGNIKLIRPVDTIWLTIAGLFLSAMMAVTQVVFTPESSYDEGESIHSMPELDYKNVPVVGLNYAPHKVNLLFDYQCPHCQEVHFMLKEVVRSYEGKLAFALCPVPLNSECNPYVPVTSDAFRNSCELTRIAMAVWVADDSVFPDFDDWMFSYETGDRWKPRSPDAAMARAEELIGKEKLAKAIKDPWIDRHISKSTQMYGQTIHDGRGGIPKMIYGSQWVIPQAGKADDLLSIMQSTLGLPKP